MINESTLHKIKPSQLINFKTFALHALIAAAMIYFLLLDGFDIPNRNAFNGHLNIITFTVITCLTLSSLYAYLTIKTTLYTITDHRIIKSFGLFNKETIDCVLYRVREVQLFEPFIYRLFKIGNVQLISSQHEARVIHLIAIKNAGQIKEELRTLIEQRRAERGINELDTY